MVALGKNSLKATWFATHLAGRFSARLSGVFASRLWFTPWPVPVGQRGLAKQAGWLRATDPIVFDSRVGRIRGFSAGSGPVVLLVHGWGERAAFMGAFIKPMVDSGHRVIGIDLPGHGETSKGRTNLFELANVLKDVAAQLGGVRAAVAHSLGGAVTAVAISEGLDLDAVILVAPATNLDHAVEKFGSMFSLPPKAIQGLRRSIERRFGKDVWDRLLIQQLAANFDVSALIVHDRDDTQIDVADSQALAAAWPGARSLITTGLGHDKIARDPKVVEAITAFLQESTKPVEQRLVSASPQI
jgi:pimeloyl-ACP methyl ester carboxylesterase